MFLFHAGLLDCGYLGVLAFFVLSGFLLTPILLGMKRALPRKAYFLHFYGRRALRIFPLYYAYLAVIGLGAWLLVGSGLSQAPPLRLLLDEWPWAAAYGYNFLHAAQSADSVAHSTLISHFWSLAVEEQFYLLWPLFLWLVPERHVGRALLAVILAGPLLRAGTWALAAAGVWGGPGGQPSLVVYLLPWCSWDAFAVGGWLALRKEPLPEWAPWAGMAAALAAGLTSAWLVGQPLGHDLGFPPFLRQAGQAVWGYSLLALAFGLVLHALRRGAFLPRLFDHPWPAYLGKISYGLYVFHYPVQNLLNRAFGHSAPGAGRIALSFLVTVGISMLSYELFEARWLKLKDRWFPAR